MNIYHSFQPVFELAQNHVETLTTFKQAQDILINMTNAGVKNIKLIYTGIVNEGMNQRSVEKVSLVSELGGKSAWNSLVFYADRKCHKIIRS